MDLHGKSPKTIICLQATNYRQQIEAHHMSILERIICLKAVLARTGLSRPTIYRKIAKTTFPWKTQISVNRSGLRQTTLNRWIDTLVGYPKAGVAQ
jgi:prophage regulatory protein